MRITSKFHAGIKALVLISLKSNPENGILQKDIVQSTGFSTKFLDQIIAALKVAGIITKTAPNKRGYILARNAKLITLYDVYLAFESTIEIYGCIACSTPCPNNEQCATHQFIQSFNNQIKTFLESKTIFEIQENQIELSQLYSDNQEKGS